MLTYVALHMMTCLFQDTDRTPRLLTGYGAQQLWVRADAAAEGGTWHEAYFDAAGLEQIEAFRKAHAARAPEGDDCALTLRSETDDVGGADKRIDTAAERALFRGVARIEAVGQGFYNGLPATLLTVHVEAKKQVEGGYPPYDDLHLVYPRAQFTSGGIPFCREETGTFDGIVPGSKILFVLTKQNATSRDDLYTPFPWWMIVETPDGKVLVPESLDRGSLPADAGFKAWTDAVF